MRKQHWFLRWLFLTVIVILFASCVNPLVRENMPSEYKTKAERVYGEIVKPWVDDMLRAHNSGIDTCRQNVEGWDELTEKQQDDFRRFIVYRSSQDVFPLDVTEGTIPVVLFESIGSLNGLLRIGQDGLMTLEHDEKAKALDEQYLCKNCGATGRALAPVDSCPDCYGTGTITVKCAKYNPETGWEDASFPCYSCPFGVCPVCRGTRYAPVGGVK